MTHYLLDTNILSDSMRALRSQILVNWLRERDDDDLFISAVSIAEIQRGILELPTGRKRAALEYWFDGPTGPQAIFAGRTLPFDTKAALVWAAMMAAGRAAGRPRNAFDTLIAATAQTNECVVVTDNTRDFFGVETINPMRKAP